MKTSKMLILTDFGKLSAEQLRAFRREMKNADAKLLVMKKRLLSILLKEYGADVDVKSNKLSVGAVFSKSGLEEISAPVYKFFKELKLEKEKILGGWDAAAKKAVDASEIAFIGSLPPREVLLGQLLGMLSSPIRSFLYVLDQKSKQ